MPSQRSLRYDGFQRRTEKILDSSTIYRVFVIYLLTLISNFTCFINLKELSYGTPSVSKGILNFGIGFKILEAVLKSWKWF